MQQTQKSAAETKPQRHRVFRLKTECAVVQTQLFERIAQQAMLVRLHGKQAREHHRLDFFKARQRLGSGVLVIGDGVAEDGDARMACGRGSRSHEDATAGFDVVGQRALKRRWQ